MPAFREEIFGPVARVVVVKDVDEAVRIANATEYGLVAAIQTGSMERGLDIAERLNTGIVHVNDQTLPVFQSRILVVPSPAAAGEHQLRLLA